nr:reverse transcriptase domain-containing protein [Tanacetum cinerariifolium]
MKIQMRTNPLPRLREGIYTPSWTGHVGFVGVQHSLGPFLGQISILRAFALFYGTTDTLRVSYRVFLGYVITSKGIKPCPNKTAAVLQLPSPQTVKEVQSLNGKLASLNRKRNISNANLLHKPGVTGFGAKLFANKEIGYVTSLCSKEAPTGGCKSGSLCWESTILHTDRGRQSKAIEMPGDVSQAAPTAVAHEEPWTLFTDGSSCVDGSGAGLILTNLEGVEFTYALRFQFAASNNEAEYEALVAGLRIATQMGVKNIQVNVDSKLVTNQVLGTYVAKEDNMIKYLEIVKGLENGFTTFSISQVPKNKQADALSKIASTSFAHLSKQVLVEVLEDKSIKEKEVAAVIEEDGPTWMTQLVDYLKEGVLPGDNKEARKLRLKARQYELREGVLYRRSFLTPWLRCVGSLQADYVMREIHEGSCSMHTVPRSVVAKSIRLEYYWLTMHKDTRDMIRKCNDCQIHRPGINIAGSFPEGPEKVKFLIVSMDYFMKWVEAKAVATITDGQIKRFVWDNIVCRFGISSEIISDNGKQFADNPFKDWCDKLNITQRFASVKHPQSNGLVERANRSLGEGIKARLGEEIGMPTYRTAAVDVVNNDKELRLNLDLLKKRRERAAICEARAKSKMMKYYNARVRDVAFKPGDFVYRRNDASHAVAGGKLGPKWEGPYEVAEALGNRAYKLRSTNGTVLPRK